MAKLIRYALATFCFAASVGCLLLWGWSATHMDVSYQMSYDVQYTGFTVEAGCEYCFLSLYDRRNSWSPSDGWKTRSVVVGEDGKESLHEMVERQGHIGKGEAGVYFPLWYPALIFALAGVAVLRFRRQFSIRSAMTVTTVVAALIGMAVIL